MGKRGAAPLPTNVKLLRGIRADRINTAEPLPDEAPVTHPAWLSRAGRVIWRSLAPDLHRKGLLTPWDVEAFARYCDASVRFHQAAKALDKEGHVLTLWAELPDGTIVPTRSLRNPWLTVWQAASADATRLGARFGLTPSDRSQIKLGDAPKKDDAADLLS